MTKARSDSVLGTITVIPSQANGLNLDLKLNVRFM